MAVEIERKFLVVGDGWRRAAGAGQRVCQGYVAKTQRGTVRVRRVGAKATVAVKSRRSGISRHEFEFDVPIPEAEIMLREICARPLIEKVRYEVRHGDFVWEVDVYGGDAEGLVLAEVELEREDQVFDLPGWVGAEVTHDLRYRGSAIAGGEWRAATGTSRTTATPYVAPHSP